MDGTYYHLKADKIFLDVMTQTVNIFKQHQHVNGHGYAQFKPNPDMVMLVEPIPGLHHFHRILNHLLNETHEQVSKVTRERLEHWFSWDPNMLEDHVLSLIHTPLKENILYLDDILLRSEDDVFWSEKEEKEWTLDLSDWFALKIEERQKVCSWLERHKSRAELWFDPNILFGSSLVCSVKGTGFLWHSKGPSRSLGLWPTVYWIICLALDHRGQISEYRLNCMNRRVRDQRQSHGKNKSWVLCPRWMLHIDDLDSINLVSHEIIWNKVND